MSWKITNLNWTVETLLINRAAIDPRPEYQRQFVWNLSMMQNLIWCMLRGQDIPKLYFHNRRDMRPRKWDVVDGQQRIETIFRFIDEEFSLSGNSKHAHSKPINGVEVAGKTFQELPDEIQTNFLNYPIIVAEIETTDKNLVIDQFLSLQYGKTLNGQEKRQARPGRIRDLVKELGAHEFVKLAQVNKKREGEFEAVARIMFWESNGEIGDTSGEVLDRFYIRHADDPVEDWKQTKARAIKVLNLLNRAFPSHHPRMRESVTFMLLYWLMRHLATNYYVDDTVISSFQEWFTVFSQELNSKFPQKQWTGGSTAGKQNENRFNFMLNHFLSFFPSISSKDPQRRFTDDQRRIIWDKAKGRCQWIEPSGKECGLMLDYDKYDADHVIPHAQGGQTSVENGRVLCIHRNRGGVVDATYPLKTGRLL